MDSDAFLKMLLKAYYSALDESTTTNELLLQQGAVHQVRVVNAIKKLIETRYFCLRSDESFVTTLKEFISNLRNTKNSHYAKMLKSSMVCKDHRARHCTLHFPYSLPSAMGILFCNTLQSRRSGMTIEAQSFEFSKLYKIELPC